MRISIALILRAGEKAKRFPFGLSLVLGAALLCGACMNTKAPRAEEPFLRDEPIPAFGAATRANFEKMLADRRDSVQPRTAAPLPAAARLPAWRLWMAGSDPEADTQADSPTGEE